MGTFYDIRTMGMDLISAVRVIVRKSLLINLKKRMKKLLILLVFFAMISCKEEEAPCDCSQYDIEVPVTANKGREKFPVCHYNTTTDEWVTLMLPINAIEAHINHGDSEGECTVLAVEELEYDACKFWCRDQ